MGAAQVQEGGPMGAVRVRGRGPMRRRLKSFFKTAKNFLYRCRS